MKKPFQSDLLVNGYSVYVTSVYVKGTPEFRRRTGSWKVSWKGLSVMLVLACQAMQSLHYQLVRDNEITHLGSSRCSKVPSLQNSTCDWSKSANDQPMAFVKSDKQEEYALTGTGNYHDIAWRQHVRGKSNTKFYSVPLNQQRDEPKTRGHQ